MSERSFLFCPSLRRFVTNLRVYTNGSGEFRRSFCSRFRCHFSFCSFARALEARRRSGRVSFIVLRHSMFSPVVHSCRMSRRLASRSLAYIFFWSGFAMPRRRRSRSDGPPQDGFAVVNLGSRRSLALTAGKPSFLGLFQRRRFRCRCLSRSRVSLSSRRFYIWL